MHEVLAQLMEDMLYPQPTESDRHKGGTQKGRNHGQMNPGAVSIMQFHLVWSLGHNSPISRPLRDVACWHQTDIPKRHNNARYSGMNGPSSDATQGLLMTTQIEHRPVAHRPGLRPISASPQCANLDC